MFGISPAQVGADIGPRADPEFNYLRRSPNAYVVPTSPEHPIRLNLDREPQSGATCRQHLQQGWRYEVGPRRAGVVGRPRQLCALRAPTVRCLQWAHSLGLFIGATSRTCCWDRSGVLASAPSVSTRQSQPRCCARWRRWQSKRQRRPSGCCKRRSRTGGALRSGLAGSGGAIVDGQWLEGKTVALAIDVPRRSMTPMGSLRKKLAPTLHQFSAKQIGFQVLAFQKPD